jgi:hypothetical protein
MNNVPYTVQVVGTGLSGLIAARILHEKLNCNIQLFGNGIFEEYPKGPEYLWVDSYVEYLFRLMDLKYTEIELIKILHFQAGTPVPVVPNQKYRELYAAATGRRAGLSMTQGRNEFLAYTTKLTHLHSKLLHWAFNSDCVEFHPLISYIDQIIYPSSSYIMSLTDTDSVNWPTSSIVVLALPLNVIGKLLSIAVPEFAAHGLRYVRANELPHFDVFRNHGYGYGYSVGTPFHRATFYKEGFLLETNKERLPGYYYKKVQTPGKFFDLKIENAYQVGRMARGDRSLTGDTIQQVFEIADEFCFKNHYRGMDDSRSS